MSDKKNSKANSQALRDKLNLSLKQRLVRHAESSAAASGRSPFETPQAAKPAERDRQFLEQIEDQARHEVDLIDDLRVFPPGAESAQLPQNSFEGIGEDPAPSGSASLSDLLRASKSSSSSSLRPTRARAAPAPEPEAPAGPKRDAYLKSPSRHRQSAPAPEDPSLPKPEQDILAAIKRSDGDWIRSHAQLASLAPSRHELLLAAALPKPECVQALFDAGLRFNAKDGMALRAAISQKHFGALEILKAKGAQGSIDLETLKAMSSWRRAQTRPAPDPTAHRSATPAKTQDILERLRSGSARDDKAPEPRASDASRGFEPADDAAEQDLENMLRGFVSSPDSERDASSQGHQSAPEESTLPVEPEPAQPEPAEPEPAEPEPAEPEPAEPEPAEPEPAEPEPAEPEPAEPEPVEPEPAQPAPAHEPVEAMLPNELADATSDDEPVLAQAALPDEPELASLGAPNESRVESPDATLLDIPMDASMTSPASADIRKPSAALSSIERARLNMFDKLLAEKQQLEARVLELRMYEEAVVGLEEERERLLMDLESSQAAADAARQDAQQARELAAGAGDREREHQGALARLAQERDASLASLREELEAQVQSARAERDRLAHAEANLSTLLRESERREEELRAANAELAAKAQELSKREPPPPEAPDWLRGSDRETQARKHLFVDAIVKGEHKSLDKISKNTAVEPEIAHLALAFAAEAGQIRCAQWLVEHMEVHPGHGGEIALRRAVEARQFEMVRWLATHGADIHHAEEFALRLAAVSDDVPMIDFLIGLGANPRAAQERALREAAHADAWKAFKALLAHGCTGRGADGEVRPELAENEIAAEHLAWIASQRSLALGLDPEFSKRFGAGRA